MSGSEESILVYGGSWPEFLAFCADHSKTSKDTHMQIDAFEVDGDIYLQLHGTEYCCRMTEDEFEEYRDMARKVGQKIENEEGADD